MQLLGGVGYIKEFPLEGYAQNYVLRRFMRVPVNITGSLQAENCCRGLPDSLFAKGRTLMVDGDGKKAVIEITTALNQDQTLHIK